MKKFTLSFIALNCIICASAIPGQKVILPATPVNALTPSAQLQQTEKANQITVTKLKKVADVDLSTLAPTAAESTETSDETEATSTTLYHYPAGTFYSRLSCLNTETNKRTGYLGNPLIPYGENTWHNLTYDSEGYVLENPVSAWEYANAAYGMTNWAYLYDSSDVDLIYSAAPHSIQSSTLPAPTLTVDGMAFKPKNKAGSEESIIIGGNGNLNPGVQNATIEDHETDWATVQFLSNVNSQAFLTMYGYNNMLAAGTENGMYSKPGNEVRENFIKNNEIEIPQGAEFFGFGQIFSTGAASPIIKYLGLLAVCKLDKDDEISFNILDITNNENVYSAIYVSDETYDDAYITEIGVEIFDEETELEYISLKPNTQYLIYVDGVATLKDFNPLVTTYNLASYTSQESFDANAYALYITDKGISLVDACYYSSDCTSSTTPRGYAPSLTWELEVEYPYLVPGYGLTGPAKTDEIEHFDISDTEIKPTFFAYNGMTLCQFTVVSDADINTLKNSIEYSSNDVKNAAVVGMMDGEGATQGSITYTPAEKIVQIILNGNIGTGSWIKFTNKNTSLTINLPVYDMSGIGDVVADGEAVATEYFDLQGRKLAGEANGIVIKKMTMADGSVKAVKVVK